MESIPSASRRGKGSRFHKMASEETDIGEELEGGKAGPTHVSRMIAISGALLLLLAAVVG